MNDIYRRLRRACYDANMLLPKHGLVQLTFGNASVVDRDLGVFAIKPSGVRCEDLTPEDMVVVHIIGRQADEGMRPSSDTPTHAVLYQRFDSIGAVVHTHSMFATSFAQACRPIPCYGATHADFFRGDIPATRRLSPAEAQADYEWGTGCLIAEHFKENNLDPAEFPGVLVGGHGLFAWGADGAKAVENALAMEIAAEMAFRTELLFGGRAPRLDSHTIERQFKRRHGPGAYCGQARRE